MRFCWLKAVSTPVARNTCPSVVPVAPKDQQDPHAPWSLGGVTAPRSRQSMPPGSSFTGPWEPASAGPNRRSCVRVAGTVKPSGVCSLPFRFAAFSSRVQSANEFSSSQNPRRLRFMEFTYRSALRNSAPRIATESAVKPPVPVEAAAAAVVVVVATVMVKHQASPCRQDRRTRELLRFATEAAAVHAGGGARTPLPLLSCPRTHQSRSSFKLSDI
mmetsp:Transcript_47297/g.93728  ORF Transcript_47297/g.93728 Transcript_47297/m.93728 type:complete len:216 (-) Transcript_47297:269-916(-)